MTKVMSSWLADQLSHMLKLNRYAPQCILHHYLCAVDTIYACSLLSLMSLSYIQLLKIYPIKVLFVMTTNEWSMLSSMHVHACNEAQTCSFIKASYPGLLMFSIFHTKNREGLVDFMM